MDLFPIEPFLRRLGRTVLRRLAQRDPDVTLEAVLRPFVAGREGQETGLGAHASQTTTQAGLVLGAVRVGCRQLACLAKALDWRQGVTETSEIVAQGLARVIGGDGHALDMTAVGESLVIRMSEGFHDERVYFLRLVG